VVLQNWKSRGWNRFCLEAGLGRVAQIIYTHVSQCKRDKITFKKRKRKKKENVALIHNGILFIKKWNFVIRK
jgi:hypothetical protein